MTDLETLSLSSYCRQQCGLDAEDVAEMAGVSRRTFYDWWRNRRRAVELIIKGIQMEQAQSKEHLATVMNEVIASQIDKGASHS